MGAFISMKISKVISFKPVESSKMINAWSFRSLMLISFLSQWRGRASVVPAQSARNCRPG